jgi:hypothetical protein
MDELTENTDDGTKKITIGKVTCTQKDWDEIRELVRDTISKIGKLSTTTDKVIDNMDSVKSTSEMFSFYRNKYPENFWQEHTGCTPCSFVCDCCDGMQHRCGGGAAMWVYGRKSHYGEAARMLCDRCYRNKNKQRCSCKINPGCAPIEVDIDSGSRRVRNKCCKCYEYTYPCNGCSLYISDKEREEGIETMTYYEFLDRIPRSKRKRYPAEYKVFIFKGRV